MEPLFCEGLGVAGATTPHRCLRCSLFEASRRLCVYHGRLGEILFSQSTVLYLRGTTLFPLRCKAFERTTCSGRACKVKPNSLLPFCGGTVNQTWGVMAGRPAQAVAAAPT